MINCTEFKQNLADFLHEESLEASSHRKNCGECSMEWNQAKSLTSLFSTLPTYEPRPWTVNKILAYSKSYQEKPRGFAGLVSQSLNWLKQGGWNWAPVAVSVFLVISMAFLAQGTKPLADSPGSILASDIGLQEDGLGGSPTVPVRNVALGDSTAGSVSAPVTESFKGLDSSWQKNYQMEAQADQLLMRGRRFKAMGRMDLALRDFDAIFQNYPNYTYIGDVLMYRAQCYAFQGHFAQAVESLKVYAQKFPSKKSLVESMINQLEQSKTSVKQ